MVTETRFIASLRIRHTKEMVEGSTRAIKNVPYYKIFFKEICEKDFVNR